MYKSFYSLKRNPFDITPDPSFLFPTTRHNEALAALYYGVRRFQRRRGRVWSIPLGGFFPLAAAVTSMLTVVGAILTVTTTHTDHAALLGGVGFLALGMGITYGWRMGRMLRQQERDHELA